MSVDVDFDDVRLASLRSALNHLYDPDRLRISTLGEHFALPDNAQRAARLQSLLLDAIRAMQPPAIEPAASIKRRMYNILQLRYEQQFSQKEVAAQLGLSVRQYRRLQQAALQALALYLTELHDLDAPATGAGALSRPAAMAASSSQLPDALVWMAELPPEEMTPLDQVLPEIVRLVEPLARRHSKSIRLIPAGGANAAIHPLVLRQALLHLLNALILHSTGDVIVISAEIVDRCVRIRLVGAGAGAAMRSVAPAMLADLEIVRTMVDYFDGEFIAPTLTLAGDLRTEVRCRVMQPASVLVVDDHADTLQLLERYTVGTTYTLIACKDPQQAQELAEAHQPCAILLDVMMPVIDGWELLTRLKQTPATTHLPVLVCTVLDQSELALSLGASGFLRKPVTRQAFLAALDAHATAPGPELT